MNGALIRNKASNLFIALIVSVSVVAFSSRDARADTELEIAVIKRPNCGCCTRWVDHLKSNGFKASVRESRQLSAIRAQLGVPKVLAACHTAQIESYVIEGHVPADAIKRLLAERPNATGLAVPGMPIGSPGMEGGTPETYDVILFSKDRQQSFGQYETDKLISE